MAFSHAVKAEGGHFATDDCFSKNPGARLPEVRPVSTLHVKTLEYLENFLTPENILHERYSKVKMISRIPRKIDTYIKRKISLSLTFQIHCSSPYTQAFYVVVLQKGEQRLLQKCETQQISTPIRIRSRIFLTRHAVTSRYCFAHFQRKSLNNNDRDQILWARETEHPTQTLVFTKTAGRQPGWGHCYLRSSISKSGNRQA